ncbi:MAG: MaoC family dehydratase N-terminal domain-containing protein [Candidatus Omnitrophica bacterium]|nr:MaoC family dehydratase N-terminal domain-containing protein [Candidatus Omnitrophota bacterium]
MMNHDFVSNASADTPSAGRGFDRRCEGETASSRYRITPEILDHFFAAFHDSNPLHRDTAYASSKGFKDRVAYGAVLNGFISHFIGVVFPGQSSLLQSVDIQYKSPCYSGDEIEIQSRVFQVSPATHTISLKLKLRNKTQQNLCASAKAQVGILE